MDDNGIGNRLSVTMSSDDLEMGRLSVVKKLMIIESYDKGQSELAIEYGVTQPAISKIIKNRDKYESHKENGGNMSRRRINNKEKLEVIKKRLDQVISEFNRINFPVNRKMLRKKAQELAEEGGLVDFAFSNGWMESFLKRKGEGRRKFHGESQSVDISVCDEWKKTLPSLIEDYQLEDIFNGDETALFWKQISSYTISDKGKSCYGTNTFKTRVSILLCVSAVGEKIPPLIIGKPENPQCFTNQDRDKLGVHYTSNSKGWMKRSLFKTWLEVWNSKLKSVDRKVLLFLDNFSGHQVQELSNIKLVFFPPNTTSHLQPLDAGLIFVLKSKYRTFLEERVISTNPLVSTTECLKSLSLLDIVTFLKRSWEEIETNIVKKCFQKCGFSIHVY